MTMVEAVDWVPLTDIDDMPSDGGFGNVMSLSCAFLLARLIFESNSLLRDGSGEKKL